MAFNRTQTLTILSGQTSSDAFAANNTVAFGLVTPAAITSTTVTFTVSADGTTFQALYDSTGATQISMAVAASRAYDLPAALTGFKAFKIVGGSAEGADRSLAVIGKGA